MPSNLPECVVRILDVNTPATVGTGFVLHGDNRILIATCVHVLRDGNYRLEEGETVTVQFHVGNEIRRSKIVKLCSIENEDVAILELEGGLPHGAKCASLGTSIGVTKARCFGYPEHGEGRSDPYVLGEVQVHGKRLLQLRSTEITKGFSGAPLCDESSGLVIGMVAGILTPDKYGRGGVTAYAVPSELIKEICPELSLDQTPVPSGTIISKHLPVPNPNFTGRKEILARIEDVLRSGKRVALSGLPGMGKTQIAAMYSSSHLPDYQVVCWLRSELPVSLASDYSELASDLNLPEKDLQDQAKKIEAARRWLEHSSGWLLVFDNVQEAGDIEGYIPRSGRGHIIITSRSPAWGGVAEVLQVNEFDRADSVEFLLKRTRQEDREAADQLAAELGDLPLALEQAGAYIEEVGISIADYLELFRSTRPEILRRGKPSGYTETVALTFELSLRKVRERSNAAADLMQLFAFLSPDDIPRSLLIDGVDELPPSRREVVSNKIEFNDAIAALRRYSLIEISSSGDMYSVHRLVQAVVQDMMTADQQKVWAEIALKLVNSSYPFDSDDVRTWDRASVLLPHVLVAAEHAQRMGVAPETVARLLNQAGLYLRGSAKYHKARECFERALEIGEKVYGKDHPNVAIAVNNLGLVLRDLGEPKKAKECIERALEIYMSVYDKDHPNLAVVLSNLVRVLQDLGEPKKAMECIKRALEIDEKVYGKDHHTVAIRLNNVGGVLLALGQLDEARRCFERALEIDEKVYGKDHPSVAIRLNNLGNVLRDLGKFKKAQKCFERALKIDRKVYGENCPRVAIYINNLGLVLQDLGQLDEARKCYERALEILREHLGEDHPHTKIVLGNLKRIQGRR